METHDDAIASLQAHGMHATRREWVLGDTVAVLIRPSEPDSSGIVVYRHAAWLVPTTDAAWELVQIVCQHEHRVAFASLALACAAVLRWAALHDLSGVCPSCQAHRRYDFGEFNGPRWWLSADCPTCGQSESDDSGPLPDELRRIELERHGTWSVCLERLQPATAWKTVREVLSLSLPDLEDLKPRLPGSVHQGTLFEVLALHGQFQRAGIASSIGPG